MNQSKSIKSPRFDYRYEYLLSEFRQFLKDNEISSQKSAPGSFQQEGVVERRIKGSLGYGKIIDELYKSPGYSARHHELGNF